MRPASSKRARRKAKEQERVTENTVEKTSWKHKGPNFSSPNEMVTFYLDVDGNGKEEQFQVHKEFACAHSSVLRAAFNSNFVEGQTQTYHLKDVSMEAFRLLVQWIYSQTFDVFDRNDPVDSGTGEDIDELLGQQDLHLIQLWVLADRFLIPELQNTIIVILQNLWGNDEIGGASTYWIPYAYEHTAPGSPLRKMAIDQAIYCFTTATFKENETDFPREMLFEMAVEMSKVVMPAPRKDDIPLEKLYQNLRVGMAVDGGRVQHGDDQGNFTGRDVEHGDKDVCTCADSSDQEDWVDEDAESEEDESLGPAPLYTITRKMRNYFVPEENEDETADS